MYSTDLKNNAALYLSRSFVGMGLEEVLTDFSVIRHERAFRQRQLAECRKYGIAIHKWVERGAKPGMFPKQYLTRDPNQWAIPWNRKHFRNLTKNSTFDEVYEQVYTLLQSHWRKAWPHLEPDSSAKPIPGAKPWVPHIREGAKRGMVD